MNTCPRETDWVLYATGELDAVRAAELRVHLASCQACTHQVASLTRGLAALEMIDRDAPMRAEAMDALRRRLAAEPARSQPTILVLARRWPWAAAASILLVVTLAWALWPATPTVEIAIGSGPKPVIHYPTDSAIQDKLTEMSIMVDIMESNDRSAVPTVPAVAPRSQDMDLEEYYEYLNSQFDT
jgi:hypothetical protein